MKFKGMLTYTICLICLLIVFKSKAGQIPEGFGSFYDMKEETIKLLNIDGTVFGYTNAESNYNTIKSINDDDFVRYLKFNDLNDEAINYSLYKLNKGSKNSRQCAGELSKCNFYPEVVDFIYDQDNKTLRMFVNSKYLNDKVREKKYASNETENGALINSFDLYYGASESNDAYATLNNRTLVGMKYGYLHSDLDLNDEGVGAREVSYNYDHREHSYSIGYFDKEKNYNSTYYLLSNTIANYYSMNFGTSSNLVIGGANNYKFLNFYSPISGSALIYRNERIIGRINVVTGQNVVPYSQLPYGRYDIRIDVVSGGQVEFSESFSIYNNKNNSLDKSEYDYMVSTGIIESDVDEINNQAFVNALFSYKLQEYLSIGFGGTLAEDENEARAGLNIALPYNIDFSILNAFYQDGGIYSDYSLYVGGFSASYSSLEKNTGELSNVLYGERDYSTFNLGYSFGFSDMRVFLNMAKSKYEYNNNEYLYKIKQDVTTYSSTLTKPLAYGVYLDLNLMYQDNNEQWSGTINLNVPIGNKTAYKSSYYANNKTSDYIKNSLQYRDSINSIDGDKISGSVEVANRQYFGGNDENISEVSLVGNYNNKYFKNNTYAYADTDGYRNISGQVSSTQIISRDGITVTDKKSDAFVKITSTKESKEKNDAYGLVSISESKKLKDKRFMYDDVEIFPIGIYKDYRVNVDMESYGYYNKGDKSKNDYIKPGSVIAMNVDPRKISSSVVIFEDILGSDASDINCDGAGCYKIERISNGVYQVMVLDGLDYSLTNSNGDLCLFSPEYSESNKSICIPNIDTKEYKKYTHNGMEKYVYNLGLYGAGQNVDLIVKSSEDFKVIEKSFGKYKSVYLLTNKKLKISGNDISKGIERYSLPIAINQMTYKEMLGKVY